MTAALEGDEWAAARPGRILPPGKTRYPLYRRVGGPQGRFVRAENLTSPGFDPRTVQPVVSRYTDCATGPTTKYNYFHILFIWRSKPFLNKTLRHWTNVKRQHYWRLWMDQDTAGQTYVAGRDVSRRMKIAGLISSYEGFREYLYQTKIWILHTYCNRNPEWSIYFETTDAVSYLGMMN